MIYHKKLSTEAKEVLIPQRIPGHSKPKNNPLTKYANNLLIYILIFKGVCLTLLEKEMATHPLQCSCLENPRDEGAWWAAVYGVTQSLTLNLHNDKFVSDKREFN